MADVSATFTRAATAGSIEVGPRSSFLLVIAFAFLPVFSLLDQEGAVVSPAGHQQELGDGDCCAGWH